MSYTRCDDIAAALQAASRTRVHHRMAIQRSHRQEPAEPARGPCPARRPPSRRQAIAIRKQRTGSLYVHVRPRRAR